MLNEGNLQKIDFNCEEMYAEPPDRSQLWNVNSDKALKFKLFPKLLFVYVDVCKTVIALNQILSEQRDVFVWNV